MRFGVPLSVTGLLLKGGIHWDLAITALIAATAIAIWMLVIQCLPNRFRPVQSPALQIGSTLGNTAYFGIPVALALLPSQALPVSIGYDLGATLLAWSLGPFWLQRKAGGTQDLVGHLTASPATRGLMAALVVQATPWHDAVATVLWWPSRVVILLALVVVGMRLGAIQAHESKDQASSVFKTGSPYATQLRRALACKLLLFPLWIWLLCNLLFLPVQMQQALVLQGAAPAAISVLLMAEHAGRDAALAARLILNSTLLAMISVPLWWFCLLRPLGTP